MQAEPEQRWVVAEPRCDGTQWPLLILGEEVEAVEIVAALRARGRDVIAIPYVPDPKPVPG